MEKIKRSDMDTINLNEYSFEIRLNGTRGILCIKDDEGRDTGEMFMDLKKINQFITSWVRLKEKLIDKKLNEQYFKEKYNLFERELLKKEVMKNSGEKTKL